MTNTIQTYPKAELQSCGDKKHKNGCYLKLTDKKTTHSEEFSGVIDLDSNNKMVGIDLRRDG